MSPELGRRQQPREAAVEPGSWSQNKGIKVKSRDGFGNLKDAQLGQHTQFREKGESGERRGERRHTAAATARAAAAGGSGSTASPCLRVRTQGTCQHLQQA